MPSVSFRLRQEVAKRAGYRCEYCRTPQVVTAQTFHIDHIVPRSQAGDSSLENLCYACPRCNLHRGDRTTGKDPDTGRETPLFHPREHVWEEHFRWSSTFQYIQGRTPIGRATVVTLDLNGASLVNASEKISAPSAAAAIVRE
ncbi:MAG: HNH endonuclease [Chloroflexi bacterium]|nr:HNH endonuclease [Chloroflexota bacterium]